MPGMRRYCCHTGQIDRHHVSLPILRPKNQRPQVVCRQRGPMSELQRPVHHSNNRLRHLPFTTKPSGPINSFRRGVNFSGCPPRIQDSKSTPRSILQTPGSLRIRTRIRNHFAGRRDGVRHPTPSSVANRYISVSDQHAGAGTPRILRWSTTGIVFLEAAVLHGTPYFPAQYSYRLVYVLVRHRMYPRQRRRPNTRPGSLRHQRRR